MERFRPIGSTYEWTPPGDPRYAIPAPSELYSTGRGALCAACHAIAPNGTIWMPSYCCADVAQALANSGFHVKCYEELPTSAEPEWDTLKPDSGDVVIAVNLFGVREGKAWKAWQSRNAEVFLIEDHTHDPLSEWAIHSTAHYAFASLRKTIPMPDGAVIWSPRGKPLPAASGTNFSSAAAYALAGMVLKKSYIATGAADDELYRAMRFCQQRGESLLSRHSIEPISAWSAAFLSTGIPADLRSKRERNVRDFLDAFCCSRMIANARPMFQKWCIGHCPLNPVLLFDSPQLRETCRTNLIRDRVFATVHWPVSKWMSSRAADIASRALTIPLDFRCHTAHHARIIDILQESLAPSNAVRQVA